MRDKATGVEEDVYQCSERSRQKSKMDGKDDCHQTKQSNKYRDNCEYKKSFVLGRC